MDGTFLAYMEWHSPFPNKYCVLHFLFYIIMMKSASQYNLVFVPYKSVEQLWRCDIQTF